jgi:ribosomal protein S18 acetylase RimI-like enzyme
MAAKAAMELRAIEAHEREALAAMAQRYWEGLMPHAPVVRDPLLRQQYFDERFRFGEPDRSLWWAVVEGNRIGFANVTLREGVGERWAEVADFYVEPAWRRQGHGRAFVRAILDWLKAQGITRADLHVRKDNPGALAFWQRVGFELALYRLRTYLD